MAELFVVGQITRAVDFNEHNLWCKWSLQAGKPWSLLQGEADGKTFASKRSSRCLEFAQPIDVHYGTCSVQAWPKLCVELYAMNDSQKCWPVGYGYVHIPSKPGFHHLVINTWKIAPTTYWQSIRQKFRRGGMAISQTDLIFTGMERQNLSTCSAGKIVVDIHVVFRGFRKFGIEYH